MTPTHIVHHADAIQWLSEQPKLKGCSIITSLPDASEFPNKSLKEWQEWFTDATKLVLEKTPDDGLSIFFQTDIKHQGVWVDKAYLCQKAAEQTGHALVAHKIVCRSPAGSPGFNRPAYSHLLAFSMGVRPELKQAFADVLPEAGDKTWARGMGTKACELACRMVMAYTDCKTIVDPFCGHGAALKIANDMGLNAIGVDHSLKCVRKARALNAAEVLGP